MVERIFKGVGVYILIYRIVNLVNCWVIKIFSVCGVIVCFINNIINRIIFCFSVSVDKGNKWLSLVE